MPETALAAPYTPSAVSRQALQTTPITTRSRISILIATGRALPPQLTLWGWQREADCDSRLHLDWMPVY
jgi:hypothetical protein